MAKVQKYKVVWIGRVSRRRRNLKRFLSESDAQSVVARYPNSSRSIVTYYKERTLSYED